MPSTLILVTGLYIVLGLFEIKFPAEQGQSFSGKVRNIGHTLLLLLIGNGVVITLFLLLPIHSRQLDNHGIFFSLFIVILYVFLTDFLFYWYHRAEHYFKVLWPIHELHHSDSELNVTTGMRSYWLERPLQTLIILVPLNYIIGIDTTATIILPIVLSGWLFFTHANLKLRLGFFTPIITGPQLHRIHHSSLPQHAGKNFAQFFPVIDIIFGTYYKPHHNEFPHTGILNMPSNTSIGKAFVRPFHTWVAMMKKGQGISDK